MYFLKEYVMRQRNCNSSIVSSQNRSGFGMDLYDTHYYKLNKILLTLIGLWPYQPFVPRVIMYSTLIFSAVCFCIPQVAYVIKNRRDLDKMYNSLPMFGGMIIAVLKIFTMTYNFPMLRILLNRIRSDWVTFADTKELDILIKYAENSRRIIFNYAKFVMIPAFVYASWPLFMPLLDIVIPLNESRPRYLIHPAEYFVDHERYYYAIVLNEYFSYVIAIILAAASDGSYFLFMEHVCGSFAVLHYRLQNIYAEIAMSETKDLDAINRAIVRRIVNCIRLHLRIKEFCNAVISVYTMFLLFDIGPGLIVHSAMSVLIVISFDNTSRLARFVIVISAQSYRLFLNSWPGQKLMDHSTSICTAAYNSAWYKSPPHARKMLSFIIMESQTPDTINFANLYVVNLDSFGTVIKTSLSYCTLMASLRET